jgi:peptide-methionine (R)-S-oxide reductase
MKRRTFLNGLAGFAAVPFLPAVHAAPEGGSSAMIERLELSDEEWKRRLTPDQYRILRREGTEAPFTSPLNDEKRPGTYHCAGCDLPLFTSDMKFDSGTGWPSFYTHLPDVFGTKRDFKLVWPRTEYHCARCGGHHGHVFNDGPPPTRQRWCNNGLALRFVPQATG